MHSTSSQYSFRDTSTRLGGKLVLFPQVYNVWADFFLFLVGGGRRQLDIDVLSVPFLT